MKQNGIRTLFLYTYICNDNFTINQIPEDDSDIYVNKTKSKQWRWTYKAGNKFFHVVFCFVVYSESESYLFLQVFRQRRVISSSSRFQLIGLSYFRIG